MRQALILFQLSLWVSTVYAFYPFVPEYRIAEGRNGAKQRASRSATALDSKTVQTNGFITFPISRRAPADVGMLYTPFIRDVLTTVSTCSPTSRS